MCKDTNANVVILKGPFRAIHETISESYWVERESFIELVRSLIKIFIGIKFIFVEDSSEVTNL